MVSQKNQNMCFHMFVFFGTATRSNHNRNVQTALSAYKSDVYNQHELAQHKKRKIRKGNGYSESHLLQILMKLVARVANGWRIAGSW